MRRKWPLLSLGIIPLFIVILFLSMCSSVTPDQGQEAVLIYKPWIFGHGGVDPTPVSTGRTFVAPSTKAIYVNMQPMQYEEKFDDLMSSDGIPLSFDSVIRFRVTDSVALIKNFGEKFYDNNIKSEFRNRVRQAVRKHGMNETAISTTAIDAIDTEVTQQMLLYIRSAHMPVQLIKITVGKANPPDAIKNQRVRTAEEQQRQITELQSQRAEEARKGAEAARAAADNAYRESIGLSPEQYVHMKQIEMQQAVCGPDKNGKHAANCTFIIGTAASPIIATGH